MAKTVDGRYQNHQNQNDVIKIDLYGKKNLKLISGTIFHKFRKNTHWIAGLEKSVDQENRYLGDIYYLNGFQDNFRYNSVMVSFENHEKVIVEYRINDRQLKRSVYYKISDSFRTVELSFYRETGIIPVTSIDPKAHYEHNSTLPAGEISLESVFDNAGLEIKLNEDIEVIPYRRDLLGKEEKPDNWSDRELHDAMERYWDKFKNHPQWAMWVFLARVHSEGDKIKGKMFDNIGDHHRQGVAIFYDSIEKSVPGKDIANAKPWIDRQKFWTTCHEIGHGLNLYHSWEREDVNSWLPLENEPDVPSFMNYPSQYKGISTYFQEFVYEFSQSELLFLRHAPDYYVRMGGADWFDKEGFGYWTENETLKLQISLSKQIFEFMEPVLIDLKLINNSVESIDVPDNILRNDVYTTIIIQKKGAEAVKYERLVRECGDIFQTQIQGKNTNDNSKMESINLSVGLAGWYISEPGEYTINAAVYYEEKVLIANPESIVVRLPVHRYEERIAQEYFTMDTAKVIYFNGSKTDAKTNNHLMEVLAQLPDRHVSIHAGITLAMPDIEPYKVFTSDMGQVKVISPDHEKASLKLENALKHRGAEMSLGKKLFTSYVDLMKEQLTML